MAFSNKQVGSTGGISPTPTMDKTESVVSGASLLKRSASSPAMLGGTSQTQTKPATTLLTSEKIDSDSKKVESGTVSKPLLEKSKSMITSALDGVVPKEISSGIADIATTGGKSKLTEFAKGVVSSAVGKIPGVSSGMAVAEGVGELRKAISNGETGNAIKSGAKVVAETVSGLSDLGIEIPVVSSTVAVAKDVSDVKEAYDKGDVLGGIKAGASAVGNSKELLGAIPFVGVVTYTAAIASDGVKLKEAISNGSGLEIAKHATNIAIDTVGAAVSATGLGVAVSAVSFASKAIFSWFSK